MKRGPQKFEHLFFYPCEPLPPGHETIHRLGQGFHQFEVAEFIMSHQVKYPCIALQVIAKVQLVIDDTLEVIDTGCIISGAEIQGSDLIIKHQDTMPVDKQ